MICLQVSVEASERKKSFTSQEIEKFHRNIRRMIIGLLSKFPYYGHATTMTTRVFQVNGPFAAGMQVTKFGLVIMINPLVFFGYPEGEQVWVLVHEIAHFLLKHPWRAKVRLRKGLVETDDKYIAHIIDNIAMDLAANSFLKHHFRYDVPKWVLMPEQFNLPDQKTYEWYRFNLTPKMVEPYVEYIGHWWELDCPDAEGQALAGRIHKQSCRAAGTEPFGELRDIYRTDAEIDYKQVLMRVADSARLNSQSRISSKRRISRRFNTVPGEKSDYQGETHWLQDTSGSMSPSHIGACYVVGEKIRRKGILLTVYEFDGAFIREYPFMGVPPQVKGGGGTMIQSTFDYIRKNKPWVKDVVVFTDGGIGDLGEEMPEGFRNVIWIVPEGFPMDHFKWGKVVAMRMEDHEDQ